ncbi:hypothetical protein [Chelatococcus asaccharovorans]|uniref:Uncharacterized protein n=1 Tax=Chelatococcus asaccharovorans TaxID=28210 RepID=A0A2V3UH32_9HYPH|nr:hypothetical protein [Chelatococcus asaccharovorans]MBS7703992.1 hypothetical protein [Chelatococcus asaccharovorans]PXW58156.1 hypothetical protein C7450_106332 [Chelatococcus asaccharovorans]
MLASSREESSKGKIDKYRILEKNNSNFADACEVAEYIAQLSGEMAAMSRNAQLDVIAYFLEMVREEARKTAKRKHPPASMQLTSRNHRSQK